MITEKVNIFRSSNPIQQYWTGGWAGTGEPGEAHSAPGFRLGLATVPSRNRGNRSCPRFVPTNTKEMTTSHAKTGVPTEPNPESLGAQRVKRRALPGILTAILGIIVLSACRNTSSPYHHKPDGTPANNGGASAPLEIEVGPRPELAEGWKPGRIKIQGINNGRAQYLAEGAAWKEAQVRQVFFEGARLRTGPGTTMDLFLWANGPFLRLAPDTDVAFEKLRHQVGADADVVETSIRLHRGRVGGSVRKLVPGSTYQLRTAEHTYRFRSGGLYDLRESGRITCRRGEIQISGPGVDVSIRGGEQFDPITRSVHHVDGTGARIPVAVSPPPSDPQPLIEANSTFALESYAKLRSRPGNLAISPFSISSAAAMTLAGAGGVTAKQLAQAFHFSNVQTNLHELFGWLNTVVASLQRDETMDMEISNSLSATGSHRFQNSFQRLATRNYQAALKTSEIEDGGDAVGQRRTQRPNRSTQPERTNTHAVENGTASSAMTLANRVNFRGKWQRPFQKTETKPASFHTTRNRKVTVPFMNQEAMFHYADVDQLQLLIMPFLGGGVEMVVLLPRRWDGISDLERSLSLTNLARWCGKSTETPVSLSMPKFEFEGQMELIEALRTMGILDAFDPGRADFSRMVEHPEGLFLGTVEHTVRVRVDEEGAEAMALTQFVTVSGVAEPEKVRLPVFRADHPFLFIIRETSTGTILFLGRVSNPGC